MTMSGRKSIEFALDLSAIFTPDPIYVPIVISDSPNKV